MKNYLIVGLLALAGCGAMQENMYRAQDEVRNEAFLTAGKVQNYLRPADYHKPSPQEPPPSYCYHTAGDLLCYKQPLPGQEERLVGYQGIPPEALAAPASKRHGNVVPKQIIRETKIKEPGVPARLVKQETSTVFVNAGPQVKPDDSPVQTIPAADDEAPLPTGQTPRDLMQNP